MSCHVVLAYGALHGWVSRQSTNQDDENQTRTNFFTLNDQPPLGVTISGRTLTHMKDYICKDHEILAGYDREYHHRKTSSPGPKKCRR